MPSSIPILFEGQASPLLVAILAATFGTCCTCLKVEGPLPVLLASTAHVPSKGIPLPDFPPPSPIVQVPGQLFSGRFFFCPLLILGPQGEDGVVSWEPVSAATS